jgi:hypothetical protein
LMVTVHGFWSVNMWLCFFILLIYCKFVQHQIMKHLSISILSGMLYTEWYVISARADLCSKLKEILIVVPPCILISTNYFLQRMHCLLKHKILQFVFKCFT